MAGGQATTLTMPIPAGEVSGLKWSPDGKSLLVVRGNVNAIHNIWSAPTDGKPPRQITSFDSAQIFAFDVAPDGRLAMSRGRPLSDVVMIKNVR
jgi:sugar lactone lactonase YvrE